MLTIENNVVKATARLVLNHYRDHLPKTARIAFHALDKEEKTEVVQTLLYVLPYGTVYHFLQLWAIPLPLHQSANDLAHYLYTDYQHCRYLTAVKRINDSLPLTAAQAVASLQDQPDASEFNDWLRTLVETSNYKGSAFTSA